jgi:hypothetical protein
MLGGGLLLASSLLMGCPNPNTYGTPRTVQKGQISHTVALEGFYWTYDQVTTSTNTTTGQTTKTTESKSLGLPMLPSYQLRYGVTDNMDFGVGIKNFDSLQGDFKFNFLKSETLDLAIDPGLQYIGVFTGDGSAHLFWLHLPLLAGINLSETFSITGSVGAVGGLVAGNVGTSSQSGAYSSGSAFLFRAGLGLNIRTSKDFAIGPEVTVMRGFNDASALFFTGGLGFTFGKHQHFKDTAPPPGSAPPGAAPASAPNPPQPPAAVTQ